MKAGEVVLIGVYDEVTGFAYADASQQWFETVFADHQEEARSRVTTLAEVGERTENCRIETPTLDARRVRFMGRQMPAYRFIFCVSNGVAAGYDELFATAAITSDASIPPIWSWDHAERTCRMRESLQPTG